MTHEQTISKRTPLSYPRADDGIKILFYMIKQRRNNCD